MRSDGNMNEPYAAINTKDTHIMLSRGPGATVDFLLLYYCCHSPLHHRRRLCRFKKSRRYMYNRFSRIGDSGRESTAHYYIILFHR